MRTVLGILLLTMLVFLSFCDRREKYYSKIILKADKIQIKKNNGLLDTTITASGSILTSFTDIFKNYEGNCSCDSKDEVIFLKNGSELLKVRIAQNTKECTFLLIGEGDKKQCYRLNYRIGMMIGELK
ncbi:MAG: hypothetical protein ABIO79_13705 [Ferruginibacter sp.]